MPMSYAASPVHVSVRSVLATTDFSEPSRRPLRHALTITRHYGAKFYLAHVIPGFSYTLTGPEALKVASEMAESEMLQLEHDLLESGSLDGIDHEFLIRKGAVWEELQSIVSQNQIDLVILGTHGRFDPGKMLLEPVAENAFRYAKCPVLTVGPVSYPFDCGKTSPRFLFATDFGEGSLCALPHAVSFANHLGAKLTLLHVVPTATIPEHPSSDVPVIGDPARTVCLRKFEQLLRDEEELALPPEFIVHSGLPSEKILHVALDLRADLIFMGLRRSNHGATTSHMPWATAYEVVCGAGCPVLTMRTQ